MLIKTVSVSFEALQSTRRVNFDYYHKTEKNKYDYQKRFTIH